MTYVLSIAEAAEIDLYKAFLWYKEKEVELGEKFEFQATNTIESIQKNPLHSQIRYSEVRVRFMDHFPYGFHYRVRENHIVITAVFHTSLSPDRWYDR